jgi:N-acetyl-anhydromuramoyl-L-alanine amidase
MEHSQAQRGDVTACGIDAATGLMARARQVSSPNCDARPDGILPELIIVHGISLPPGDFGGPSIDRLFTNTLALDEHPFFATLVGLKASSHLLIRRDGQPVQYVPFHLRAWHAGVSRYQGRERCNDFSIGIELEGTDERAYEPMQYRALCEVIVALSVAYPTLSPDRVVGHSDVAPGRKTDPGDAFDWRRLRAMLKSRCAG